MGGYRNCGTLLGPLNTRCRIILRNQKGTIILTIPMCCRAVGPKVGVFTCLGALLSVSASCTEA